MSTDYSKLKRERLEMPSFIQTRLDQKGLIGDYYQRPAYQQNDYVSWILKAKREETRNKRIMQMLAELKSGGVYMNMTHLASVKD